MLRAPIVQVVVSFAFALALLGSSRVTAQENFVSDPFAQFGSVPGKEVQASLVSEVGAIRPGETFTVGLKMVHSGPWHTYWENPGTGQPTRITWDLPQGLTAGPIQWPVPEAKKDVIGTSNIYGGTIYLLTDIAVADDVAVGSKVTVAAKANWLQCDETCKPGKAQLSLDLPVVADPADVTVSAALKAPFERVRAQQPVSSDLLSVAIEDQGTAVLVKLTPAGGANSTPGKVHVFHVAKDALTEPSAEAVKQGNTYVATFEKNDDAGSITGMEGFAFAENGWGPNGTVVSVGLPPLEGDNGASESATGESIASSATGESIAPSATASAVSAGPVVLTEMTPAERTALDEVLSWGKVALGGEKEEETLPLILIFAFLGGLILNLMPCVFPVLGIKIMGFVNQAGEESRRIKMHGLVFGAGVLFSMWVLVAALLAVKVSTSGTIVWGEQLRQPWFVATMIGVIYAFGLSLAGLFEIGASLTTAGGQLQNKKGYSGSFFSGLLTVLIASPCTGPFMAPAISFAFNQPAFQTLLIFTVLGLGLASPYIVLSFFPALIQKLPRPGAWMETFKQFMAFPMLATVVWLVAVFGKQMGVDGVVKLLIAMLILTFGLWIFGRYGTPIRKTGTRWTARITLVVTLAGSVYAVQHSIRNRQIPEVAVDSSGLIDLHGMKWEPLTLERLVDHRKKGRTVFIDFTADW